MYLYLLFISEESLVRLMSPLLKIFLFVYLCIFRSCQRGATINICLFVFSDHDCIHKYKNRKLLARSEESPDQHCVLSLFCSMAPWQNKKEIIKIIIVNNDQELPCAKKRIFVQLSNYSIIQSCSIQCKHNHSANLTMVH